MTQRLAAAFARAAAEDRAALITFVTGGDPSVERTADVLDALVAGGVDVIEMGMPFTDPMADGPAIQAANLRALSGHVRTRDLLGIAAAFRARHPAVPLVLMGYFNPILAYGVDRFAADAAAAGVDGLICVDVPPEEDAELGPTLRAAGIDFIRLATPTTDARRLPVVLDGAHAVLVQRGGFVRAVGQVVEGLHLRLDRAGFQEGHRFVEHAGICHTRDIAAGGVGQPQEIVREMGAHTASSGRMPPVLHIAFAELPTRCA